MGVELDWESASIAPGQLPEFSSQPRRKWPWFLLALLLVLIAIIYLAVSFRLQQIEEWQHRTLRDVVTAEVTALRIGDENAFLDIQHSGDEFWLNQQREYFQEIQRSPNIILTGEILESEIRNDGLLGIVRILEIDVGEPYERLWFYWNFDPLGWKHLPQDTDFWGKDAELSSANVSIDYRGRDETLAHQLAATLPGWVKLACEALACANIPPWQITIAADPNLLLGWDVSAAWHLRIPSPYLTRARSDLPFSPALRFAVASLLSDRMLSSSPIAVVDRLADDALYLQQALRTWLLGSFIGQSDNSPLLQSIVERYGVATLAELINLRSEQALLPAIRQATRAGFNELLLLDWRDYLDWQLLNLYPGFLGNISSLRADNEGETTYLYAKLQYPEGQVSGPEEIRFALIGDHWQLLPG